jgi:hypothetical protein
MLDHINIYIYIYCHLKINYSIHIVIVLLNKKLEILVKFTKVSFYLCYVFLAYAYNINISCILFSFLFYSIF